LYLGLTAIRSRPHIKYLDKTEMSETNIYERLALQMIRTTVLREIAALIPENYYAEGQTGIELKVSDGKLGRMLYKEPMLTERQTSACNVLAFCGFYGGVTEALARCEDLRRKLPSKQEDVEDAYSKLVGWVDFAEYQLREHLGRYRSHLPDEEEQLLSPAFGALGALGALGAQERQRPPLATNPSDPNSDQSPSNLPQNLAMLFDPLPRAGITVLFDKEGLDWGTYFARAATNKLIAARHGGSPPILYNPYRVGEWLVAKGLYSQEDIDRKLAKNLPRRSRDMTFLFTGKFDY
jgi:hypothetical protein